MIRDSFLAAGHPAVPLSRSVQTGFRRERRNALLLALAVLLGGIALTFGSSHALQRAELREFETVFDLDADRYLNGIARDLRANEVLLRGATGLFAASDMVTASEWSIYVSRLNSGPSAFGTLGMGYSQRVAPALRSTFEASMRAGGNPDFAITPAGEREQLQAITHLAPRDKGNDKALGVDLLADPVLGTSIGRARDSGQIVLTPSVPLPFSPAAHPAALLIEPVYLDSMPRDNLQQRAQAFIGFTFVLVDIESLARVGLDGLNPAQHVRIIDKTEMPARELFSSDPGHPMRGQTLTAQRTLDAFGRSLTLEFDRQGGSDSEIRGSSIALPSGILASLLLALLTWHLGSSRARVQSQVRRMTRDLRESELGLQQSQALLSSVIDGMPSGVVLKNEALQISLANRAFCDLLGCTAAEAVGRYCADVVDPSLARQLDASDLATLESGQEHVSELVLGVSDGRPRAFLVRKVSLPGDAPQVLAIYTDITERRQAEERLRTSEMRWQSALEGAGDAVWDWNMVTDKLFLSRRWKQILGYTETEVGDDLDEFSSRLHPEDRQRVLADVEDHIQGRTDVYSSEFRIRRKDGGYLWVNDRGRIVERDADGRPTRMIGRFSDISERKQTEAELARHRDNLREMVEEQTRDARVARDEAQRANQAKSAFLANMSHELRTPMHAILAFAKLGETRAAQDDAHKLNDYFGSIRASGDRLLALLNDLLDLSKLEAGKMVLDLRLCALDRLVREVAREFDEVSKAKGVQLRVQGETALAEVALDCGRISQVLRNLLSNAVKFTPQDRTVDIRCGVCDMPLGRRRDDQGLTQPGVEVVVSDEGVGIPPTELERVFDKFVQSSRTRTGAGGTGLGLAISREIVEAHRGEIFARNNAKGGTDFVVRLPSDPSCPESRMQENRE